MTADVRRRSVLAALGVGVGVGLTGLPVLGLAGCAPRSNSPEPTADQAALDEALAGELSLVAAATAAPGATATAAARAHLAHANALVAAGASSPTPSPDATPTSTPTPSPAGSLAAQQRAQASKTGRLALGATPDTARLLSSISASDASFASLGGRA